MTILLYVLFFLSGLAGLIYESIWSRYLGLFVGHGAYAQVIVLAVFLGGMAMGALLAGRRSERVRHPLLWYAGVELAVGILGLTFHDVFVAVSDLAHEVIFPALAGTGALVPVKWVLAGAMIFPPALLMGTTFPLMGAAFLRLRVREPGHTLAILYFVNSFGASLGAVLSGFFLVAWVGLPGTVLAAAVLDVVVALGAWAVWRHLVGAGPEGEGVVRFEPTGWTEGMSQQGRDERRLWRLLLAVSFATAAASFVYEIAWIRMLSLVLGAATHSFDLMLSAFILGLALGALWVRHHADRFEDPIRALGWLQCLMGLAALATLPIYMASFQWTAGILGLIQKTETGYHLFNAARYGLALSVMLPATFFAGTTLPLITRTLLMGRQGERAVGWVYGMNTLGSILGVTVASLVLLPWVGLKALLILGGLLDVALGAVLLTYARRKGPATTTRALAGLVVASAAVLTVALGTHFDLAVLNSGVFRERRASPNDEVVYHKDGRTATVAVVRAPSSLSIATDGKTDASVSLRWMAGLDSAAPVAAPMVLDEAPQTLLAMLTLAHRPDARLGAVVGQGSGMTSHVLLGSPHIEQLVTIEIEPAMIEGSRRFYPANRRVFDDPRASFVGDDAKSYLSGTDRKFDLVVSEPSNPWVAGVASLFTTQFYETVSGHLAPGGVFGQWIQLYEIDDGLILGILAAVHQVFGSYQVFMVNGVDALVVATNEPVLPEPDWGVFDFPGVQEDLRLTHPFHPRLLEQLRFLDRASLAPVLDTWPQPNSDYFPILDLGAERARFLGRWPEGFLRAGATDFEPSDVFLPPTAPPPAEPIRTPVPQRAALRAVELTSRLRAARGISADSLPMEPDLRAAVYRVGRLEAMVASSRGPSDWSSLLADVADVGSLLHGASRGWTDSAFYAQVNDYASKWQAPEGAVAGLAFLEGLQGRDWSKVARASGVLDRELGEGRTWIPLQLLLDGGVMSRLLTGDIAGGEDLYRRLVPLTTQSPGDLRSRLLRAYVENPPPSSDGS